MYGKYSMISFVAFVVFLIAAIMIGKTDENSKLNTKELCNPVSLATKPVVGDICNVWDDKKTCFTGKVVKMANGGLGCEKPVNILALVCLIISGLSFIAGIVFAVMQYRS